MTEEEKALVIQRDHANEALMPVMALEEARERYSAMVAFVKGIMQEDKDYGTIPGTQKPTLLKPGAEKLCRFFGLSVAGEVVNSIEQWDADDPFFFYHCRCRLSRGGILVAEGDGSCNSREDKYAWTWMDAPKPQDEAIIAEMRAAKTGRFRQRGGAWIWQERVPQSATHSFTIANTILKMAQKRALIAATLVACNASEFFTQDLEDMGIAVIEGEFEQAEVDTPPPPSKKRASQKAATQTDKKPIQPDWDWNYFWGPIVRDELGMDRDGVHEVLGVESVTDYAETHSMAEAISVLRQAVGVPEAA
jgi:hypothetical protein